MKAPAFWYAPPGTARPLLSALLTPAALAWTAATRRRLSGTRPWHAPVPVICVGNLVAGGAGKTPVVLDLLSRLRRGGLDAHALSRGHGGRLPGPLRVDPARHTAAEVGDEPLLLAAAAPAWIARDRAAGARAAADAGAGVLVLDDGFQNPGIAKDLSLLVVDGDAGFGNGRVIPAGPLREPVADGLARAQAVLLLGEDRRGTADLCRGRLPVLRGRLVPDPQAAADLEGRRVLAFAGIGRPEKLFRTLEALGADVVARLPFPDHHPFTAAELRALLDRAAALDALPVTTQKDLVRLPAELRGQVRALPVSIAWEEPDTLDRLLAPLLSGKDDHGQAQ
ncbi:tetraacyldisaccharide 4'-kinase [Rhodospirillum centenum]|uniref:Tetraacyldisaccharide 4'-kinase n=1 Tax=Rhodospirillum centenum (strain ATCC 51521 / SW) TaxID=414684 RepID=LPXK_RHOCS|nr:tetraacyldisaccharide 4'-kinase [Rhodospirillum centenum]B6IXD8.1 RecName: Full=Tetraacyldisaccharide 4'-kinase; AltName: Full=Lipid A 4'-kinase [Rhodospirillum centenum SW]ACJ00962.1 tetraacyldisaccharide 4'-kinase [Rhodospirillum centenum SW]